MSELYHIEERTTTGWHLVDSARVPMPKDVCWQAYQDLVEDGGDPADLRIVRDRYVNNIKININRYAI